MRKFIKNQILTSLFLFGITACFSVISFAQEEMFNNRTRTNYLTIGTDSFTLLTGVPNIYLKYQPSANLRMGAGAGFMPFGFHADPVFFLLGYNTLIDRKIENGLFVSIQGDIMTRMVFMDIYLYTRYKRWSYTFEDYFVYQKNKFAFGLGAESQDRNGFNIGWQFGVFLGYDKISLNDQYPSGNKIEMHDFHFDHVEDKNSEFMGGFDFSITLSYTFFRE